MAHHKHLNVDVGGPFPAQTYLIAFHDDEPSYDTVAAALKALDTEVFEDADESLAGMACLTLTSVEIRDGRIYDPYKGDVCALTDYTSYEPVVYRKDAFTIWYAL